MSCYNDFTIADTLSFFQSLPNQPHERPHHFAIVTENYSWIELLATNATL